MPGANFSSGTVELNGRVTQKQNTQTVTGQLTLADLTGQIGNNSFARFGSAMDVDVTRTPKQVQIKKLNGALTQGGNAGGNFDLAGSIDPVTLATQLTLDLSGFNQNGLRPFLEPLLAGKKLVSIAINGNASVQYDPNQSSAIKADLQVTNLVVNDPAGKIPATPLSAGLQIDTTLQKQSADIRRFQISLTPTKTRKHGKVVTIPISDQLYAWLKTQPEGIDGKLPVVDRADLSAGLPQQQRD